MSASQKMSPQILMATNIMTLPVYELRAYLHQEAMNNPALDLHPLEEEPLPAEHHDDYDIHPDFSVDTPLPEPPILEQLLATPETLVEHLSRQLHMQTWSEQYQSIGQRLIANLDAYGFHREDPRELFSDIENELVPDMLYMIRRFDPIGTCVMNACESLMVQAEILHAPHRSQSLIRAMFQDEQSLEQLAEQLGMSQEEQESFFSLLPLFNPYPGNAFSQQDPQYIVPDLHIYKEQHRVIVRLTNTSHLSVDPYFAELANQRERKTENSFALQHVQDARILISALELRQRSMKMIVHCIVEHQKRCFLEGLHHLRPLLLRDIAAKVSMSESTVSRVVSQKYAQTEWGILPLKYFFSTSVAGVNQDISRVTVLHMIREIVAAEKGQKRLTDQSISDILLQRGVKVARRTVSKYRGLIERDR